MTDIIIIGGGTAGMTAAIYAARAGKTVKIIESGAYGGQITAAPRVENYPGFPSISGLEFADKLVGQVVALDAETEFSACTGVTKNREGNFTVHTDDGDFLCRAVILATGAKHRALGLPREEDLIGEGVSYCAVCDGSFYRGKAVAVVGGGSAALQQALYLSGLAEIVTLIHRRAAFRGEEKLVSVLKKTPNVKIKTDCVVTELVGAACLEAVRISNVKTGKTEELPVEGLFAAIGQTADNEAFRDLVALDENGFIVADESCKTSCSGVFAAGDCRTKSVRQLATAVGDGAIAATAAAAYSD